MKFIEPMESEAGNACEKAEKATHDVTTQSTEIRLMFDINEIGEASDIRKKVKGHDW